MSITTVPKYLTIPQAAVFANVSARTLQRQVAAGTLPVIRIGGCVRIMDETLAAFMAANEVSA